MIGSIFRFTRTIITEGNVQPAQTVLIFAADRPEAVSILANELAALRLGADGDEPALLDHPDWTVEQLGLDSSKVLSFSVS